MCELLFNAYRDNRVGSLLDREEEIDGVNIYYKAGYRKGQTFKQISIPLSENKIKHLIFTGKNGSGKTSVLESLEGYLENISTSDQDVEELKRLIDMDMSYYAHVKEQNDEREMFVVDKRIQNYKEQLEQCVNGLNLSFNLPTFKIRDSFKQGKFILAVSSGKTEKADVLKQWFEKFEVLLQQIFDDNSVRLVFDEDTFQFSINMNGREPFGFNALSSGYAAVLDIVVDIIIRMERNNNHIFGFDTPGIVLIDEVETHLHLELQRNILKLLTTIFANVQFVLSTHSPFVLNSMENVVIYDLEKKILVEDGLADIPYDGIVEGYFDADQLSNVLKEKFETYKELVHKNNLTDDDYEEVAKLELYLDEIPNSGRV